jgi:hypothetical protein
MLDERVFFNCFEDIRQPLNKLYRSLPCITAHQIQSTPVAPTHVDKSRIGAQHIPSQYVLDLGGANARNCPDSLCFCGTCCLDFHEGLLNVPCIIAHRDMVYP